MVGTAEYFAETFIINNLAATWQSHKELYTYLIIILGLGRLWGRNLILRYRISGSRGQACSSPDFSFRLLTLLSMGGFWTVISKCSEGEGDQVFFFAGTSATKRFARSIIFRYGLPQDMSKIQKKASPPPLIKGLKPSRG